MVYAFSGFEYDYYLVDKVVKFFNLYSIKGKVVGAVPVLFVVYFLLTIVMVPTIYAEYKKKGSAHQGSCRSR